MDRSDVLRIVVACGATLVAMACIATSAYLEHDGKPTPAWVGAVGGSAFGLLYSLVPGRAPPAAKRRRKKTT